MRHRAGQFNMPHALTPDLGQGHFNTAFFTNHATMLEALVLATQTFIILDRAKDFGAKQTITLRFECTVIYSLRFFNFAIRPGTDLFRGSQTDGNSVEFLDLSLLF